MKKLLFIMLIAVVIAAVAFVLFWPRRYESTFYPMGGIPFKVVCYDRNMLQFDSDTEFAEKRVGELEEVLNRFKPESELGKFNSNAHMAPQTVSEDFWQNYELSRKWYHQSGGIFDPTVGPLVNLWKKAGKEGKLPGDDELAKALETVGFNHIATTSDKRILLTKEGMNIDFGGIAKGYIVDEVVKILKGRGVESGVVEAGGDAYVFGDKPLTLGIQDPTAKAGEKLMGTIDVANTAVVTSGDYERFSVIDGKKYSHILDPRTGRPSESDVMSATVVGGDAVDADAIATILLVFKAEEAIKFINGIDGVGAIIVARTGDGFKTYISKSLINRVKIDETWSASLTEF